MLFKGFVFLSHSDHLKVPTEIKLPSLFWDANFCISVNKAWQTVGMRFYWHLNLGKNVSIFGLDFVMCGCGF